MSLPLPERMRPASLDEVIGQEHLLGANGPLRRWVDSRHLPSLLLWGPPGVGKTTLARLLAAEVDKPMETLSAVHAGVKDLRAAVQRLTPYRGVLFIDEVHRFNKAQQDALLPHVEAGDIVFIGATTENPGFSVNNALLSRVRLHALHVLDGAAMQAVIDRALAAPDGLDGQYELTDEAREALVLAGDGDARQALGALEAAAMSAAGGRIDLATVEAVIAARHRRFDAGGDVFYDQISALHKSIRGSDPDAALYWLARMLDGGADPLYLARRLVRIASEDIGNAEPGALTLAQSAATAFERLGSPEGELALAQVAAYLACAPKSNAVYLAWSAARASVTEHGSLEVPVHLRNAPTRVARAMGHGQAYRYAHDEPDGVAWGEEYLPEALRSRIFYQPTDRGVEARIGPKLAAIRAARKENR